jgi:hypothetical protein
MEEGVISLELNTQEIMAALSVGQLWPQVPSPLMVSLREALWEAGDKGWDPAPDALGRLRERGIVSPGDPPGLTADMQRALSTLVEPTAKIITCFGTSDTVGVGRYFGCGAGANDALVLYQDQEEEKHLLSFFHSSWGFLKLADQYTGFAPPQQVPDLTAEMSFAEYAVLLGLIDAQRTAYLEAMLHRQPPPERGFTPEEVQTMLLQGQSHHDIRWLVPLLDITAPLPVELSNEQVAPLLEQLAGRGYVRSRAEQPATYRIHPDLSILSESLLSLLSFFYFGLSSFQPRDEQWVDTHFAVLRGLDALWIVDYVDLAGPTPMVKIGASSPDELKEAMSQLFADLEGRAGTATCATCGAALQSGQVFCTQCGSAVTGSLLRADELGPLSMQELQESMTELLTDEAASESLAMCPDCGAPLTAEASFCVRCGRSIGEPSARTCQTCGAQLIPENKFCTQCGATVQ